MNVSLIAHTPNPDYICAQAAAICTDWRGDPIKALKGALGSGHESVAEHAGFTFLIDGVSRVLLAQITRHRMASFSVQSQRYCGADKEMVIPEGVCIPEMVDEYIELRRAAEAAYDKAISLGIPAEDARYFTLQGGQTKMIMTMNSRELRHFFSLRCCNRAQWEIRQLADEMLRLCKDVAPVLFRDSGPGCVRGKCPEGNKSCGKGRDNKNA